MGEMQVPTYDKMFNQQLKAIYELGGSGTIEEINSKTAELLNLSDEILEIKHGNSNSMSEVDYRLAWGRTYLKKYGLLENSDRGIWALRSTKTPPPKVDPKKVIEFVREKDKAKKEKKDELEIDNEEPIELQDWREELKNILQNINPDHLNV